MRGSQDAVRALDGASWAVVPAIAEAHGLAALTAGLVRCGPPPEVAAALHDLTARTLARSEKLARDRVAVGFALEAAGVPFTFLKGAWLTELGLISGARPAADIDLYAPPSAAPQVHRALAPLGYRLLARSARHRVYGRRSNLAVVDERGEHPDNPRPVEVHSRTAENFRGIALDLTGRLRGDRPLLPLPLGAVHVAAHATVDALGRKLRAMSLLDISALSGVMSETDWAEFEEIAGSTHAARFVWPALELAATFAAAPVPDRVRSGLKRRVAPALASWVSSIDVDGASRLGRTDTRRTMGEILTIWPRGRRETAVVWRAILFPTRWELADRYPQHAARRFWPLMYGRHAAYNAMVLARRYRLRT